MQVDVPNDNYRAWNTACWCRENDNISGHYQFWDVLLNIWLGNLI